MANYVYIRRKYNYNRKRRNANYDEDSEAELGDEDSEAELGDEDFAQPEGFDIIIFGETVFTQYTNSGSFVNTWISKFVQSKSNITGHRKRLIVGLDIQLVESDSQYPPVATIQLCIKGQCLIYHMYNALRLPIVLYVFLIDPNNTFVGVNLDYKLAVLKYWSDHAGRIEYHKLGFLAHLFRNQLPDLLQADLTQLASKVLGEVLVVPRADPDWDHHTLSDEQIMYACVGAYVSYRLGRELLIGIE